MEEIRCENTCDLTNLQEQCQTVKEKHQNQAENAILLTTIFSDLIREEEQKIEELFVTSQVSSYFARMTKDRYKTVHFDRETKEIHVKRQDGTSMKASQLSAGTLDQLYFAIRIGLAELLLSDKRGFFILDDPFIKADNSRIEEMLTFCQELASNGWQILYFSAKKEIYDCLLPQIGKNVQIVEPKCE